MRAVKNVLEDEAVVAGAALCGFPSTYPLSCVPACRGWGLRGGVCSRFEIVHERSARAAEARYHAQKSSFFYQRFLSRLSILGIQAFADALLVIPKTLADNAGHDPTDVVIALEVTPHKNVVGHCRRV